MTKVHPIEHLRYVARSHGADPVEIALEAADALGAVARDTSATLVAARRLVEHHPVNAQLWTICAHAVTAMDPRSAISDAARSIGSDPTASHLAEALDAVSSVCSVGWSGHVVDALTRAGEVNALVVDSLGDGQDSLRVLSRRNVPCELVAPEGIAAAAEHADATMIPALALGDSGALCPGGALAIASVAYCASRPVWLVAPAASRLSNALFEAMVADVRGRPDPWACGYDVVPVGLVSEVFGPAGRTPSDAVDRIAACPHAPELLRRSVI